MSRGLGWLQREILETLDKARPGVYYEQLGIYDVGRTKVHLAKKLGRMGWNDHAHQPCVQPAFQASFSRAMRTLVDRGLLIRVTLPSSSAWNQGRQLRYVRRPPAAQ
jgi:hypothetical protein